MSKTQPTLIKAVEQKGKNRKKWADIEAKFSEEGCLMFAALLLLEAGDSPSIVVTRRLLGIFLVL